MTLQNVERETIILYNEQSQLVEIYTYHKQLINKIHKANQLQPDLVRIKCIDQDGAVTCELPKNRLSINIKPPISEERSKQYSMRMKAYHEKMRMSTQLCSEKQIEPTEEG